ncbi:hypothetical protein CJ030_MR2G005722 [Morella rubra]|uniref:Uncharacterized protein n=1 Tax=Morella rubra TaxID=262757 RepID=A0A6A1WG64_9ROSI|nr:hypothetical protein CJ030_MR2G005722 [Morella rubra]
MGRGGGCKIGLLLVLMWWIIPLEFSSDYRGVDDELAELIQPTITKDDNVMKCFGFGERWLGWVQQCISTISFSVLPNGEVDVPWDQGPAPSISHLLFVDDIMVFARANRQEVVVSGGILAKYSHWSGQLVKAMSVHSKYLGLPLFIGRSREKAFKEVKAKILAKVAEWKIRSLSQARRTIQIKSITTAMPIYCISYSLLPKGWCTKIDKILKDFWWGFPTQKPRNYMPRAWDSICLPKELGGLASRKCLRMLDPFVPISVGRSCSWVWLGILQVLPQILVGARNLVVHQQASVVVEEPIGGVRRRYLEHSSAWLEVERNAGMGCT